MRWTGIIVGLFLVFHLADLTWGTVEPRLRPRRRVPQHRGHASAGRRSRVIYIVANIALGIHLFHGAWRMFQSLGLNNPRFNAWRRGFAIGFAALIIVCNVIVPDRRADRR